MKQALRHDGAGGSGNTRTRQLAARREQLIAVAEQLFLQHGFANTSVNAIVRDAGGSLATLYAEFGSKEALFESVLSERAARFFPEEQSAPRADARCTSGAARARDAHVEANAVRRRPRGISHRCSRSAALPGVAQGAARSGNAGSARSDCALSARPRGSRRADDRQSGEAARLAASQFIALVQGQIVFSAACGGEISARTRATHVNEAVKRFLKMYGKSG